MQNFIPLTGRHGRFNLLTASWSVRLLLAVLALAPLWAAIYWASLLP